VSCKGKSPGHPRVSEQNVQRIGKSFLRSPKMSISKASRELQIPQIAVWKVLLKHFRLKPYKLQLVQALKADDKVVRHDCCCDFQAMLDEDDDFVGKLVFSDEATFHIDGKVNCRIWGTENPHVMVEQERDSPKVSVFCTISLQTLYGPFFFTEAAVTGDTYLEMFRNWLMPAYRRIRIISESVYFFCENPVFCEAYKL
jgi:hypothetical protein